MSKFIILAYIFCMFAYIVRTAFIQPDKLDQINALVYIILCLIYQIKECNLKK